MKDLKNKKIIITGATGGIGNSIVKILNESGARILATGTRLEKLKVITHKKYDPDGEEDDIPSPAPIKSNTSEPVQDEVPF